MLATEGPQSIITAHLSHARLPLARVARTEPMLGLLPRVLGLLFALGSLAGVCAVNQRGRGTTKGRPMLTIDAVAVLRDEPVCPAEVAFICRAAMLHRRI